MKKGDTIEYNIPIYLDINLLLDLLASLEDGFSTVNKFTTSEQNEHNTSNNKNVGFGFGQFFNLGFGKTKNDANSSSNASEIEKYYTYGSMMNKLLSKLHEKELVKTLDDEESWNQLRIYDFVEIQGKFKPNPLSDSLNKINKMLDLAIKIAPLDNNKNNNQQNDIKNPKNITEMIDSINNSLEKENSQKYLVEINSNSTCILNLFNEYIRDNAGLELPYGNFKVLGKIIKKTEENENYNLLEETPFALSDELIDALIGSLKLINEQMNLPEIKKTINGRCIQIIPIAIYV